MTTKSLFEHIATDLYKIDVNTDIRSHLGASIIGSSCRRAIYYDFKKYNKNEIEDRIYRIFKTGHLVESRIVSDLKKIGYKIHSEQLSVRHPRFKNFGGSIDAIIELNNSSHILEIKSHNEISYRKLVKSHVQISHYRHYAQMQIYMHLLKIHDAIYLSVNKNTDEIYTERIKYDNDIAVMLCEKAEMILANKNPPPRISPEGAGSPGMNVDCAVTGTYAMTITFTTILPPSVNNANCVRVLHNKPLFYPSHETKIFRVAIENAVKPHLNLAKKLRFCERQTKLDVRLLISFNNLRIQDGDNRIKTLLDACTRAGIWGDDSQIYRVSAEKRIVNIEKAICTTRIKKYRKVAPDKDWILC